MRRWIIYGIERVENGELLYVGQTIQTLEQRYEQHIIDGGSKISKHITENGGAGQFVIKELHTVYTVQDAWEWERHLIMELDPPHNTKHKTSEEIEAARKLNRTNFFTARARWSKKK